jgi:hypothetical protein
MASPDIDRPDAAPIIEFAGTAKVARWVLGGLEILAVGVLVPVAILIVGTPVVLAFRLVIELSRRL